LKIIGIKIAVLNRDGVEINKGRMEMKNLKILPLVFSVSLLLFSCSANVREIRTTQNQYQIVAETKGKDMDETMAMFHEKARSVCQEYEIVNINTDVTFDWGLFAWTMVPLNKRAVTGTIRCKEPSVSAMKSALDKDNISSEPQAKSSEKSTNPIPFTSASDKNIVTVTWTFANIRSGAGNEFPFVTSVKKSDNLIVIGELGEWFNVRLKNGQEGWISNRVVK